MVGRTAAPILWSLVNVAANVVVRVGHEPRPGVFDRPQLGSQAELSEQGNLLLLFSHEASGKKKPGRKDRGQASGVGGAVNRLVRLLDIRQHRIAQFRDIRPPGRAVIEDNVIQRYVVLQFGSVWSHSDEDGLVICPLLSHPSNGRVLELDGPNYGRGHQFIGGPVPELRP